MALSGDTTMMMPVAPTGMMGGSGFGNGFGDNGFFWIVILFLFAICGFGRGGYSNGGGQGGGDTGAYMQRGFDNQAVVSKLDGITQGICNLGYDQLSQMNNINTNVMQTGFGIQSQLANCCCETREAIQGVNYNLATQSCDTRNTIQGSTRDILENNNSNTRAILDALTAQRIEAKDEKIAELQSLVNSLNLAQSQANQNTYLVNTLRPCPTPAYITCNPWAGSGYGGCGNGYGNFGGCGCNG